MVFATLSQKRCLKKQTQKHGFSKTPKLPVVDEYLANYKHSWTWSKKPPENKRHTPRGGRRTCYLVVVVVAVVVGVVGVGVGVSVVVVVVGVVVVVVGGGGVGVAAAVVVGVAVVAVVAEVAAVAVGGGGEQNYDDREGVRVVTTEVVI